jgi:Protein of unknown function (DUF3303)
MLRYTCGLYDFLLVSSLSHLEVRSMKVLVTWAVRQGAVKEAVGRFLAGKAAPPEGVKLLGRWHKTDCSGGFALYETDSPAALFTASAEWTDVLESHDSLVVEDAEAGPVLAKVFGK